MAYSGITATEAQIDQKIGANMNAAFTDTMKTQSLLMAESWLNSETKYNWSDGFAALDVDVKSLVTELTASKVAMDAINYDPSGVPLREAETRLDVLWDIIKRNLKTLIEVTKRDFMIAV